MIVMPYYDLPNEEGLYRHYRRVAESVDIGVVVYNNAATTKLWIPPHLMARISKVENIIGLKENTINPVAFYWMKDAVDPKDMVILCGQGHRMYPYYALHGCPGFITEISNFIPSLAIDIYKAGSARYFNKLIALIDKVSTWDRFLGKTAANHGVVPTILSKDTHSGGGGVFHATCKEAMTLIGVPGGKARDPGDDLTPAEIEELKSVLQTMGAF